ncbi:endo-1,4-beta-xylanase [Rhodopseudomonas sp. NSM]|uniref:endo-1,4-beta-xylanase n=1 Tax=Rhodopseudomonas sp. NSM TaxID=3457630 RepID=UPI0040375A82
MNNISRRRLLQMTAAGLATSSLRPADAAAPRSLAAIAARNGIMFGSAAAQEIDKDAAYRELYVAQTKIITTDVAFKMSRIAPQAGPKQYGAADRLLAFCDQNKIAMRGHCLIWNESVPAWVKAMSVAERRSYFDSYIDEVVARYVGRLQSWDLVNEPFWPGHRAPGGFRVGPWYDAFGTDYILRAFRRAVAVDPKTPLVLNEAQTERDDEVGLAVRSGLLKLVADLKNAGAKLDVVGLQSHLRPQFPHDPGRFSEFLHQLADHGVDIYLTEFDVDDTSLPADIAERDAAVAQTAKRFLEPTLRHPAVKALITWQLADKYSFWRGMAKDKTWLARPLPYDDNLQPKPLWTTIAQALESAGPRAQPSTSGRSR